MVWLHSMHTTAERLHHGLHSACNYKLNDVLRCADGTEPVKLPWPSDDAPVFDAYWLQDMEASFDPTATEPLGAEVRLASSALPDGPASVC